MGGTNQATCPPPAATSSKSRVSNKSQIPVNSIRYHEDTSRGEVDFHDDQAGLKCCIASALFFDAYSTWRPAMADELTLTGSDGSGGHASVTFLPYADDAGEMQVSMVVKEAIMGQSVKDLDALAGF